VLFALPQRQAPATRRGDGLDRVTLLGIVWIGIPLAHAVLLRDLRTTARPC